MDRFWRSEVFVTSVLQHNVSFYHQWNYQMASICSFEQNSLLFQPSSTVASRDYQSVLSHLHSKKKVPYLFKSVAAAP
jgi:hypothetical protein